MGSAKSKKKEVILVGLDGSGKTTTLKYIMQGNKLGKEKGKKTDAEASATAVEVS